MCVCVCVCVSRGVCGGGHGSRGVCVCACVRSCVRAGDPSFLAESMTYLE